MLLRLFRTSSPCASTETPKFWKQYRFMCLYSLKFSRCREETERWTGLGCRAMSNSTSSSVADRIGNVKPLPFMNDEHGGVIIEMTAPMDPQVFSASLKASLAKWREQVIPLANAYLLAVRFYYMFCVFAETTC
jgi:hypothetical protein